MSPYSRATFVKYSSGLLFSGPSDHRLSPSEGPSGNFLGVARHIPCCYAGVRAASTRGAHKAFSLLARAVPGFETPRAGNQRRLLKILRPSISRTPTRGPREQTCCEWAPYGAATHPESQTPGTLRQAAARANSQQKRDLASRLNADDAAPGSQSPRKKSDRQTAAPPHLPESRWHSND